MANSSPARPAHREVTGFGEPRETVSPARANETLGPSPYESVGGCGRQRLGALVLAPHHGADGQAAPLQRLHDEAAPPTRPAAPVTRMGCVIVQPSRLHIVSTTRK